MKKIIKDYFTFSKKERVALLVLVVLIAVFVAMPYFYTGKPARPAPNKALEEYIARSLVKPRESADTAAPVDHEPGKTAPGNAGVPRSLFLFDPNKATPEEWQRLGISAKTTRTILNYLGKGGKFRKAGDIRKIWGIRKEDAERLLPFVRIENTTTPTPQATEKVVLPKIFGKKPVSPININTANEEEWKSLPGIGEVLAKRILKFREIAGGFTSIEQVGKTYGLADSIFNHIIPYLKTDEHTLPKWDLNQLSAFDLKRRLHLDDATARSITTFRKKAGPFRTVEDLLKIDLITDTLFKRIVMFLKVEQP